MSCFHAESLPQVSQLPEGLKMLGKYSNIWGDGNVLYLDFDGGSTIVGIFNNSKKWRIKRVNFTVYKLYLNFKKL